MVVWTCSTWTLAPISLILYRPLKRTAISIKNLIEKQLVQFFFGFLSVCHWNGVTCPLWDWRIIHTFDERNEILFDMAMANECGRIIVVSLPNENQQQQQQWKLKEHQIRCDDAIIFSSAVCTFSTWYHLNMTRIIKSASQSSFNSSSYQLFLLLFRIQYDDLCLVQRDRMAWVVVVVVYQHLITRHGVMFLVASSPFIFSSCRNRGIYSILFRKSRLDKKKTRTRVEMMEEKKRKSKKMKEKIRFQRIAIEPSSDWLCLSIYIFLLHPLDSRRGKNNE